MPTRATLNRTLMDELEMADDYLARHRSRWERDGVFDLDTYRAARRHLHRATLIAQALDLSKREAVGLLQSGYAPRDVAASLAQLLDLLAAPDEPTAA